METSHQSPLERIASKAHWAERFFLVVLIAGVGLRYGGMQMMPLIYLGLVGLAITYFLFAFRVPDVPRPENGKEEKFGFLDLLMTSIVPKVLGIGMAVSMMGTLFFLLEYEGYPQMLQLGGTTIVVCYALIVLSGSIAKYGRLLAPMLLRSLLVVAVVGYVIFIAGSK